MQLLIVSSKCYSNDFILDYENLVYVLKAFNPSNFLILTDLIMNYVIY